ncbi:MAG: hypothetical protein R3D00_02530 [Bacteroidia bacterium]
MKNTALFLCILAIFLGSANKVFSQQREDSPSVKFTLQNSTLKSIPLIIPSVMNPNLSPFSKSGVEVKIGQEILFRENGKNYTLLIVDEKIKPDQVIDVAALLKDRRQELGLKK